MSYVDGFVVPVPKNRIEEYKAFSTKASKLWKEKGAIEYVESIGDDVPPGKVTSFPLSLKLKDDEVVVFSWILYKSRADRDRITKEVMDDPAMKDVKLPYDGQRMYYGGFQPIAEL